MALETSAGKEHLIIELFKEGFIRFATNAIGSKEDHLSKVKPSRFGGGI